MQTTQNGMAESLETKRAYSIERVWTDENLYQSWESRNSQVKNLGRILDDGSTLGAPENGRSIKANEAPQKDNSDSKPNKSAVFSNSIEW
jgi:hypothetical protein